MAESTELKKNPLRVMIDTNIHDKIEHDEAIKCHLNALVNNKKIKFLTTHIQIDELSAAPKSAATNEEKIPTAGFVLGASRLDEARLGDGNPRNNHEDSEAEVVPTAGAVWGTSKWGRAKWGDGSQSGISIDDIKTTSGNRIEDALISTTASLEADIFVTEDKKLYKRLKNLPTQCEVLDYAEFKGKILKY